MQNERELNEVQATPDYTGVSFFPYICILLPDALSISHGECGERRLVECSCRLWINPPFGNEFLRKREMSGMVLKDM